jgi:hypothetical protein
MSRVSNFNSQWQVANVHAAEGEKREDNEQLMNLNLHHDWQIKCNFLENSDCNYGHNFSPRNVIGKFSTSLFHFSSSIISRSSFVGELASILFQFKNFPPCCT